MQAIFKPIPSANFFRRLQPSTGLCQSAYLSALGDTGPDPGTGLLNGHCLILSKTKYTDSQAVFNRSLRAVSLGAGCGGSRAREQYVLLEKEMLRFPRALRRFSIAIQTAL